MSADEGDRFRVEAAELRRDFDRHFAAPDPAPPGETDDFVAVRVGGQPFALRVTELARIEVRGKVVPLPGAQPGLLGLVSVRGRLVPVYGLEFALGLPTTPVAKTWIAVSAGEPEFGVAFDALDGYVRVPRAELLGGGDPTSPRAVRVAGELRPVVSLLSARARVAPRPTATGREPSRPQ